MEQVFNKKRRIKVKILDNVPREKAFYFFTSIGNYTGENASSFKEFREKIRSVDIKSLEFHLYRGDFERWIADVLEDKNLATEINRVKTLNYAGCALRTVLESIIDKHYEKLVASHRK
jgi:hypothetical protein